MKIRFSTGRRVAAPAIAAVLIAVVVRTLFAHAVVFPESTTPGAYEKYVLRVPNERGLPTIRVSLEFPDAVRVVSFADVSGWMMETTTDDSGRVTEAVWTGNLPVQRFVEFPFVAVNPRQATTLEWRATQSYGDGEQVNWTGPEGSSTPASFTVVRDREASPGLGAVLGGSALLVALLALGMAMRRAPFA